MCYYFCVQPRIPFAAANLGVACRAVGKNCGVVVVAFLCMAVQFSWLMLWTVASTGIYKLHADSKNAGKECAKDDEQCKLGPPATVFLLLVSLYWGQQLIKVGGLTSALVRLPRSIRFLILLYILFKEHLAYHDCRQRGLVVVHVVERRQQWHLQCLPAHHDY